MRILLVSPRSLASEETSKWLRIPQLSLPILAALTPAGHDVVMVEEEVDPLPAAEAWDVVGVTAMTANVHRAYQLASRFRRQGARVILGGIHPSVMPEEAAEHADAVVIGEAEGIWPQVLDDIQHNRLQRFYRNAQPDLANSPLPARVKPRRLLGLPPYLMPIMATRGCPYQCEFCSVHRVYGLGQRHLPIDHVVADIVRNDPRLIMFLDDNIGALRPYAMQLFEALRPLRKKWCGQATVRFILDEELFRAAVRSGLRALFVGVETVEPDACAALRKSPGGIALYDQAIARCRSAGVMFHASLIFGLDEQTPRVFEHTLEFLLRNSVPSISPNILTPYPGTPLFERLTREGRILHTNWTYYDHTNVCYQPRNMSPEELAEKYIDFRRRFLSWSSIAQRLPAQWNVLPWAYLGMNLALRQATGRQEQRFQEYFTWLHNGRATPTFDAPT
jgi:radical SAM superfamily enzyme YgiQ (UPF0313 family)